LVADSNTLAPDDPSVPKDFYTKIERRIPRIPGRESVSYEPAANSYSDEHVTRDFVDEMYRIARLPKVIEARNKMKIRGRTFLSKLKRGKLETIKEMRDGRLTQPTAVLWGLNDPSAPFPIGIKLFKLISSKNPDVQFHLFNRAGHYVFRERPQAFARTVVGFLGDDILDGGLAVDTGGASTPIRQA